MTARSVSTVQLPETNAASAERMMPMTHRSCAVRAGGSRCRRCGACCTARSCFEATTQPVTPIPSEMSAPMTMNGQQHALSINDSTPPAMLSTPSDDASPL